MNRDMKMPLADPRSNGCAYNICLDKRHGGTERIFNFSDPRRAQQDVPRWRPRTTDPVSRGIIHTFCGPQSVFKWLPKDYLYACFSDRAPCNNQKLWAAPCTVFQIMSGQLNPGGEGVRAEGSKKNSLSRSHHTASYSFPLGRWCF